MAKFNYDQSFIDRGLGEGYTPETLIAEYGIIEDNIEATVEMLDGGNTVFLDGMVCSRIKKAGDRYEAITDPMVDEEYGRLWDKTKEEDPDACQMLTLEELRSFLLLGMADGGCVSTE